MTFDLRIEHEPLQDVILVRFDPPRSAFAGVEYSYQVVLTGTEKHRLVFHLAGQPDGMGIDRDTGLLRWVPRSDQVGRNYVVTLWLVEGGCRMSMAFPVSVRQPASP